MPLLYLYYVHFYNLVALNAAAHTDHLHLHMQLRTRTKSLFSMMKKMVRLSKQGKQTNGQVSASGTPCRSALIGGGGCYSAHVICACITSKLC